jgi:hypothetical protein
MELHAGVATLGVAGIPGWNYQLQRSVDLKNWAKIVSVVSMELAPVSYDDPLRPGAAFYRVLAP